MNAVRHVGQQDFTAEALQSPVPVLVDFYADWCGPCRMLAPILERLATEFAGRLKVVKVNIDQAPGLADQFRVESIPTLILMANGKVVDKTSGLVPEAVLRNALEQVLVTATPNRRRVG
jgi:thioredoxin 2